VVVQGDSLVLALDLISPEWVVPIVGVVQYLLLPDLHDCPLDITGVGQHLDLLDFAALDVEISLRIQ
jgi:hypothetical protein